MKTHWEVPYIHYSGRKSKILTRQRCRRDFTLTGMLSKNPEDVDCLRCMKDVGFRAALRKRKL